jgi:hypothetical protein
MGPPRPVTGMALLRLKEQICCGDDESDLHLVLFPRLRFPWFSSIAQANAGIIHSNSFSLIILPFDGSQWKILQTSLSTLQIKQTYLSHNGTVYGEVLKLNGENTRLIS